MPKGTMIGVDLAKTIFQVHGASMTGLPKFRKKLSRQSFPKFMAEQSPAVVVMKACGSAHHWAREMIRLGHEFPGWIGGAEADAVLNRADIFVLASRAENQPVSILEAMARSVPVVATRVGAIPERIDDGTSGILVEPGNAQQLAAALEQLIVSPEKRQAFGAAAQARFIRNFSVAVCAQRFAAMYRAL